MSAPARAPRHHGRPAFGAVVDEHADGIPLDGDVAVDVGLAREPVAQGEQLLAEGVALAPAGRRQVLRPAMGIIASVPGCRISEQMRSIPRAAVPARPLLGAGLTGRRCGHTFAGAELLPAKPAQL